MILMRFRQAHCVDQLLRMAGPIRFRALAIVFKWSESVRAAYVVLVADPLANGVLSQWPLDL